jgi:hypothetical protein
MSNDLDASMRARSRGCARAKLGRGADIERPFDHKRSTTTWLGFPAPEIAKIVEIFNYLRASKITGMGARSN